jgi:O-antigen ligase
MATAGTLSQRRPERRLPHDISYHGQLNNIAKISLIFSAFFLWTNRGFDIGIQQLSFCQAFSVVSFLATLPQFINNKYIIPKTSKTFLAAVMWPSVAIILVITMSMYNASSVFDSARFYGRWVYGLLFIFSICIACRRDDGFYKIIILSFLAGGALTAILCGFGYVNQSVAKIVFQDQWSKRAMGFLSHPNQLAMLYAGAVVLAFWPKLCTLPLRAGIILLLLAGLLMTGSKFNMGLAIFLAPALLFWLPAREGRIAHASASILLGIPLVTAVIAAGVYFLQQNNTLYYNRLLKFANDPGSADTTTSRFDLYSSAWNCTMDSPLFGIGAGNARECLPLVHAHNVFVNYMLETGFVGLFLIICFFFSVIKNCMSLGKHAKRLPGTSSGNNESYRASALLLMCVIGYILSNCSSDSMGPATMPTLWLYVGLTLVQHSVVEVRKHRFTHAILR